MNDYRQVASIIDIGAIDEQFKRGLAKVIDNIADPATEATAKRKITITVAIRPTEDRVNAATEISVKTDLAAVKSDKGSMSFEVTGEGVQAFVKTPTVQPDLFIKNDRMVSGGGNK
jgi:hypothetical protein